MYLIWIMFALMAIILPFNLFSTETPAVIFSFYLLSMPLLHLSYKSIVINKNGPAYASIFIFSLLFFYIAPIAQLSMPGSFFINTFPRYEWNIIYTNIIITSFLAVFCIVYEKRKNSKEKIFLYSPDNSISKIIPILLFISIIVAIWGYYSIIDSQVISQVSENEEYSFISTIKHKLIFMIPFATLCLYLILKKSNRNYLIILALVICVLLTKNILFDRRNSLGPVYIALLFLGFYRFKIDSRNVALVLSFAFIFMFPLFSIFQNNDINNWSYLLSYDNVSQQIMSHFRELHYDAWANINASIDLVETNGISGGFQLLGAILFFIPRQMWPSKPVSSGQVLGEYLSDNYGLWFTNISFPFPSEGYVDFGFIGVLIYAVVIAWYCRRLDWLVENGNVIDKITSFYFALFLLFVMRGSFLPAFAFGSGAYIALKIIPSTLAKFTSIPNGDSKAGK